MVDTTTSVSFVLLRQSTVETLLEGVTMIDESTIPITTNDELHQAATDAQTVLDSENQPVFKSEIKTTLDNDE